MKQLLIGTSNPGKLAEYKKLLNGYGLELLSSSDVNIEAPEETGETFEENAILKAKYYFHKTGIPTLADDGGFEILALNGEPGVKSHRWLGRESTDEELIAEVIKRMQGQENRHCKLTLVIAVASPFGVITSEGSVEGLVADKPSDKTAKGFPFRSVMYFPNYKKYYIELNDEEHEILNHRKAAIEKIEDIFKELSI